MKKNIILPRVADSFEDKEIMYAELVRKCRRCKMQKPLSEFSRHKQRKDGSWNLRANCKPCNVIAVSEWYQKHKETSRISTRERYRKHAHVRERVRNEGLKRTYGITIDQYNELLIKQEFKCAICLKHQSEFERNFDIDHCHTTGKIRGLCCIRCNRGIGLLQDSIQILENAVAYLKKNKI